MCAGILANVPPPPDTYSASDNKITIAAPPVHLAERMERHTCSQRARSGTASAKVVRAALRQVPLEPPSELVVGLVDSHGRISCPFCGDEQELCYEQPGWGLASPVGCVGRDCVFCSTVRTKKHKLFDPNK